MDELYTETILDHFQYPRHRGQLTCPDARITEHNPLCGDTIHLDVSWDGGARLFDLAFTGQGCAISQAALSLLSDTIIGKTPEEIERVSFSDVQKLLGVVLAPARAPCALLGLAALKKAAILHRARLCKQ
ncbi:iron-sulfur cluster assembly scaffold protein [Candidatus Uhrbacteria bacterium]|nr:iron-sulfur cluster assembly scaffold protein [Candidatus Uhrbacteria bacterium]